MLLLPFCLLLRPAVADASMLLPVIKHLGGLWLPAISCFAGFWFSGDTGEGRESHSQPSTAQTTGSYALSIVYFIIALTTVSVPMFIVSYHPAPNLEPTGPGLVQQVGEAATSILTMSPIFLAPIAWITGRQPSSPSSSAGGNVNSSTRT